PARPSSTLSASLVRVLALDYGSARCGCALSDPTGTLATPIDVIERPATRRGFARVVELVRGRGAGARRALRRALHDGHRRPLGGGSRERGLARRGGPARGLAGPPRTGG